MTSARTMIDRAQSSVLRTAGVQQTTNELLYVPPRWRTPTGSAGGFVDWNQGIVIRAFEVQNRSGATASVGIGFRLSNRTWIGGRLSADGATYTDLTSALQAPSVATVQVPGADQTGFAIGCNYPFNWLSAYFTTAETNAGGATVVDHTILYSKGATWSSAVSVNLTDDFTKTNAVWGAGVANLVWTPPIDWTVSAGLGGVPDGFYWLRFTSADREAGDVAAVITGLEVGRLLACKSVGDSAVYASENCYLVHRDADALVAYFATAAAGNRVYAEVEPASA